MLLQKYTPNWINDFESIKKILDGALHQLDYSIEHVGSTSVPGLDAKPIIDIDIIYFESHSFEKIKSSLLKLGYYHNGNQGIEDRDVFKRNGQHSDAVLDTVQHHLYVCKANSKALERHILSRNYLRANEWAMLQYQEMKYELAAKANQDKKTYANLKEAHINDFIDFMVAEEKRKTSF